MKVVSKQLWPLYILFVAHLNFSRSTVMPVKAPLFGPVILLIPACLLLVRCLSPFVNGALLGGKSWTWTEHITAWWYCERVYSGVCDWQACSVHLCSIRCQMSSETKTHRKRQLWSICWTPLHPLKINRWCIGLVHSAAQSWCQYGDKTKSERLIRYSSISLKHGSTHLLPAEQQGIISFICSQQMHGCFVHRKPNPASASQAPDERQAVCT